MNLVIAPIELIKSNSNNSVRLVRFGDDYDVILENDKGTEFFTFKSLKEAEKFYNTKTGEKE